MFQISLIIISFLFLQGDAAVKKGWGMFFWSRNFNRFSFYDAMRNICFSKARYFFIYVICCCRTVVALLQRQKNDRESFHKRNDALRDFQKSNPKVYSSLGSQVNASFE